MVLQTIKLLWRCPPWTKRRHTRWISASSKNPARASFRKKSEIRLLELRQASSSIWVVSPWTLYMRFYIYYNSQSFGGLVTRSTDCELSKHATWTQVKQKVSQRRDAKRQRRRRRWRSPLNSSSKLLSWCFKIFFILTCPFEFAIFLTF